MAEEGAAAARRLRDAPAHVVHALYGYECHGERVERLFAKRGIDFAWATAGDVSLMTDAILERYFAPAFRDATPRAYLSCTLNHLMLYERVTQREDPFVLVFEDDPCFLGDFKRGLDRIENEVRALRPGHIVSLENSTLRFPSLWKTRPGRHLYRARRGRCTGAYLVDREGAARMVDFVAREKCDRPIDHWHNLLAERGILDIHWAHPALVEQGSHNGVLASTVSRRRSSLTRRTRWIAQKAVRATVGRLLPERHVVE